MITKDKLLLNLKDLKSRIPEKPMLYTPDYPKTVGEALKYYCNQRTIHTIQACTMNLNMQNWPLPLWYNPDNIKLGFFNSILHRKISRQWKKRKKNKKTTSIDFYALPFWNKLCFNRSYDKTIVEAFGANINYIFLRLNDNPLLLRKKIIIDSIHDSYKDQNWVACISTIFPLIDYVVRKMLNTSNLTHNVVKICKLFESNGFTKENAEELMPYMAVSNTRLTGESYFSKERKELFNKMCKFDFGLIGPPLSSFLRFSNIYYSYFKEDNGEDLSFLNRHAIIHGSTNNFGSRTNTVKLITFLFLILELEPVFEILFNEQPNLL
jgi:hypothetical protein